MQDYRMRNCFWKISLMCSDYKMDLNNTSEHPTINDDVGEEDAFINIVNSIIQLTSAINVDFPGETELPSSDSDDEEEDDFWFLESTRSENRPLKKEFVFLEEHSLVKKIIYEENEEVEVLVEEKNKKREMTVENKQLKELIQVDKRRKTDDRFAYESQSNDDNEETTKCFGGFVEFFRRFKSIICSCLKSKK
ncbi:uncharacterized protein LOC111629368 isoform X1 [Centruroides sculpturatus]|uniref:uncharacterized protein LOC111629368 isoform X1 n=1 Tax=Centruroides sculpturatus TaxID=218467 RepID=UPI000C6F0247|nr:uncharacterized protein LOC111629368 isoform X1 [Centruroides sculpturatus]